LLVSGEFSFLNSPVLYSSVPFSVLNDFLGDLSELNYSWSCFCCNFYDFSFFDRVTSRSLCSLSILERRLTLSLFFGLTIGFSWFGPSGSSYY